VGTYVDTGSTRQGDAGYGNLVGWSVRERVLEVRVPWALLGFADPTTRRIAFFSGVGAALRVRYDDSPGVSVHVHAGTSGGALQAALETPRMVTPPARWSRVCYCERFKQAAAVVAAALSKASGRTDDAVADAQGASWGDDPVFCECVAGSPAPAPPLSAKAVLLVGAMCIILTALLYAGWVRPLLERVVPGCTPSTWRHAQGRVRLQVRARTWGASGRKSHMTRGCQRACACACTYVCVFAYVCLCVCVRACASLSPPVYACLSVCVRPR
jgi:hypothetical protein